MTSATSRESEAAIDNPTPNDLSKPLFERMPLPEPGDDIRPRQGLVGIEAAYLQGDKLPVTSSVLISNSKYLNDPYYREAYAVMALRRVAKDLPPTYMVPPMIRAFQEVTDFGRVAQLIEAEKKRFPEFGEWLGMRRYTTYGRSDLSGYLAGTLGHAIHEFLGIPGMEMEFLAKNKPVATDMEYLLRRRSALHDIEHLVTGFGPNAAGENALSMVNVASCARFFTPELAHFINMANVWITTTGYCRAAHHYPHVLPTYMDAMRQGMGAGLSVTKPLFMCQWEDYLDWQLEDLAKHLGIVRGPGAAWDWTTEATMG